jgi:hypothetical protein
MTGDGARLTPAMSLALLSDPAGAPAGAVAVLRAVAVDLIPFVSPAWTGAPRARRGAGFRVAPLVAT